MPTTAAGMKNLVCRVCQKGFSKAEHLRRHERCHTGSKPFVCKECRRPFARQDALTRHEKLHTRATSSIPAAKVAQGDNAIHLPPQPTAIDALPWDTTRAATEGAVQTSAPSQTWNTPPSEQQSGVQHTTSDLDFTLIWPDSENLFHSIMSSDTTEHWQMPLGTLPFPPVVQDINAINFGSPNSFDDRSSSIGTIPSGGSHQAVRDVSEMVTSSSSSVTAAIKATSITSVFLDECLHMFFVRFIPTFPILHRATFVFRECTHPLLLNAMALGSLYLGPKDSVAKGEALWRLAHTAVATSWQSLITHRGPYDACKGVQLLITALLGQIYGALSKNRMVRTTSQVFRPLGFTWARHCGMLDSEPYSAENLPLPSASHAEKDHQWRVWAAREIQQRALLAYHILDGLVAQTSGDGASTRHVTNPLILPSSEAAFDAGNPEEWLAHMRCQKTEQPSFRLVFRSLFPPVSSFRPLDYQFSAFALRVVLEGLQSLVSDSDESDLAAVGVPGRSDVRRALAQVHETITMSIHLSAPERLEVLLRWHTICLDTMINSTILCRHVCSRYNISQQVSGGSRTLWPGFDMVKWVNTEDARRALLHAIAIQDIIEQLPRGRAHVIHMPSSLFAAATIYVIFSLAGVATIHLPRTIVWQDALLSLSDLNLGSDSVGPSSTSETRRFVEQGRTDSPAGLGAVRNLVYEMNSMQKLFRCLISQWAPTSLSSGAYVPGGVDGNLNVLIQVTGSRAHTVIASSYLLIIIYALTLAPVAWVYAAEVWSLETRASGMSIAAVGNWLFNFALGLLVPPGFANITWKLFIVFGVLCIGAAIQVFFTYPETCGKTLEEVEEMFSKNGPKPWHTKPGHSKLDHLIEEARAKGLHVMDVGVKDRDGGECRKGEGC